jgi:MOSC domain-containing protein
VKLSALFIYPIKACAGISLARSQVVARGLAFDRRYMLVDRSGTFVSQREMPRLCLVETALDGASIVVSSAGRPPLRLPRELSEDSAERRPYNVWDSSGQALRHTQGSRWFSELLDDEVDLLFMPESERRSVNPKRAHPGDIVSFADGYPLLLISEASLSDLNSRLTTPVSMPRFRPNLVISGCEPYAEDQFASLRIGGVSFRAVKRCPRCPVVSVDPETAALDKEPLRTLSRYRLQDGQVWFGMNLIHDGPGVLELGDAVYLQ